MRLAEAEVRVLAAEDAVAPAQKRLKPLEKQRPRPVLVRFHDYPDKQHVMDAARKIGSSGHMLMYGNSRVFVFHNSSAATLRKHKRFDEVKKWLRAVSTTYTHLYPASLKVVHNALSKVFDYPAEVEKCMASLNQLPMSQQVE
ncbi:hypothetical protein SRHO_G00288790 [Serrasalmus rhombeus]